MTNPPWLHALVLGNPVSDWIIAALAALLATAGIVLVRALTLRRLLAVAARTETLADDALVELIRSVRKANVAIIALCLAVLWLDLHAGVHLVFRRVAIVFAVLQGMQSGNRLVAFWLEHYAERRGDVDRTTVTALGIGAKAIVWLTLLLVGLENLGFDIKTLIAGLGVGGIALALAVQSILGDLFAALSIVLDKPFVLGDFIVVDQISGTVEHVGLKTTRIRSWTGEQVVISNADLLRSRIRNHARQEGRRLTFVVTVAPGTPTAKLARVPLLIAEAVAGESRAALERTHLVGSSPLGFDVETAILVPHPDYSYAMDVRQALLLTLFAALEREQIPLARASLAAAPIPTAP